MYGRSLVKLKFVMIAALSAGSVIFSGPLFGHHGAANFENKTLAVKGTVVEWYWANPHCVLKFDEKADNGQVRHWVAETQAPNFILDVDSRWSKNSFKPGDQVTVTLRPAKDGQYAGSINKVLLADGTELVAFGKPGGSGN
jgi:Family of unknown function (DUF6152)